MTIILPTRTQITPTAIASPFTGVMVSPGRYVNLERGSLTLEQKMRASIDGAMRGAKFTHDCLRCENILVETILLARQYRLTPHYSYRGKKVTRQSFGTKRPNNRNQELIRFYLLSKLWHCYLLGTRSVPVVNNRRNPDTQFVTFVKSLGVWFGLGNVVKNLERYQAYRKYALTYCIDE